MVHPQVSTLIMPARDAGIPFGKREEGRVEPGHDEN